MMDVLDWRTVYLVSVWVHVLAAVVWIGGMVFLAAVLVPALRRPETAPVATTLLHRTAQRFRWMGWIALTLLILTGILNLGVRGYGSADLWTGELWQGSFGRALLIKVLLVAVTLVMSAVHDFVLGPKTVERLRAAPELAPTRRLRYASRWMGRLTLLLALVILWLAVSLPRGGL